MTKEQIAAYRASRITRDYTFTDELLDAYEKLEKQDATTTELLAKQHAATVALQAKLGKLEAVELVISCAKDIIDAWPQFSFKQVRTMCNKMDALKEALEMVGK